MRFLTTASFLISTLFFCVTANATTPVAEGKVTMIENGWYGEGVAFVFTQGVTGCAGGNNSFAISKDHPGYKEMVSILLTGFSTSANVRLHVEKDTCLFGSRTKVLAVVLVK